MEQFWQNTDMDVGNDTTVELHFKASDEKPLNVPLTIFRLLVCILGILGNLLVIFVILVLAEYKKAVTHWYVLQLAIADSIFLLTIPFRVVEDIENGWNFDVWMCKAKETILFLNYYSSISFLVVMSIDRYIAVCHGFSSKLQKLRTPLAAGIITIAVWLICLLICIPIMIYSTPRGNMPHCRCEYQFPKASNPNKTCLHEGEKEGTKSFDDCVKQLMEFPEEACTNLSTIQLGSGSSGFGLNFDFENVENLDQFLGWDYETTASPGEDNVTFTPPVILQPGCHYFDFTDGFRTFVVFNFVVMFLIPLIIMSACYALIIHRLYRSRFHVDGVRRQDSYSESKSRPGSLSSTGKKRIKSTSSTKNKNRVRVTIMCAAMVTLFFVCWLPFHAVHLARFVGIQQTSEVCFNLFSAVSLIAFANSAINPFVYNFVGTRFRKRFSSATSVVRESVKKRTASLSGTIQHHYKKRTPENATSNSQTGTVTTKFFKGKNDPTSAELSSNVFSDDKTNNEEQTRLTAPVKSLDQVGATSPLPSDSPPSYENLQKEICPGISSKV